MFLLVIDLELMLLDFMKVKIILIGWVEGKVGSIDVFFCYYEVVCVFGDLE